MDREGDGDGNGDVDTDIRNNTDTLHIQMSANTIHCG